MTYSRFCYLMVIKPNVDFEILRVWDSPDYNLFKERCRSKGLNGKQILSTWEFFKEKQKIF